MCQLVFNIKENKVEGLKTTEVEVKIKKFHTKRCKWCGEKYEPESPHQLYCSQEHTYYAKSEYCLKRVRRFRKKYHNVLNPVYTSLGSGELGQHACEDFEEERSKILSELKKLGIYNPEHHGMNSFPDTY